jgi:hypothetical protein
MEESPPDEDSGRDRVGVPPAQQEEDVASGPMKAEKTRKQQAQGGTESNKDRKTREANNSARSESEGVALPMSLIKALRGKSSSGESGSSSSNGGGSGNNSDNSALISLGNTSFGFNFDCEEAMMNGSPQNSEGGDSDGNNNSAAYHGNLLKQAAARARQVRAQAQAQLQAQQQTQPQGVPSSKTAPGPSAGSAIVLPSSVVSSHNAAAAAAVANLQSIAAEYTNKYQNIANKFQNGECMISMNSLERSPFASPTFIDYLTAPKRKSQESVDNDSGGYNTDEDSRGGSKRPSSPGMDDSVMSGESDKKGGRKKKKLDDFKREERNAREKERSFRISKQINELRNLLSSGGVIVPKGTKSSVLTEAANYIRMLQQHQYRSEM